MFAEWQISQMYFINKVGNTHKSPKWTGKKIEIYDSVKSKLKYDYNKYDFAVALEIIYSNQYCLFKEWFPEANE